jgi:hypothetical protein
MLKTRLPGRSKPLVLTLFVALAVGGAVEVGIGLSWPGALLFVLFAVCAISGGEVALDNRGVASRTPISQFAFSSPAWARRAIGVLFVVLFGYLAVSLLAISVVGP